MKIPTIAAILLCFALIQAGAQPTPGIKAGSFAFSVSLSDYSFCKTAKDSSLSNAFARKDWLKPADKSFGIGVGYWKGITGHLDFSGTFTGTMSNFPAGFVKGDSIGQAALSAQLDASLHLRLLNDRATVNPFLSAGMGIGSFAKEFAAYAPLGTGLQFRFKEGSFMVVQAQWRKALTAGITSDYIMYSLSFIHGPVSNRRAKKDAQRNQRPEVPSIADADHDGVSDADDKCPTLAGPKENNGCPVVKDEIIKKVNLAEKQIYFDFASDEILDKSYAALDEVAAVLQQDRDIKIKIEAHSDNRGTHSRNMGWSEKRAKSVADYFIAKGIDPKRITHHGYGDTKPIADNKTEQGRSLNRRVEIKLNY